MNKDITIYLKGYTVHQVEHKILGKHLQAYVGTILAFEHAVKGDFKNAYYCIDWAQQSFEYVKIGFPDIWLQGAGGGAFEEVLARARNTLGKLEKKLETREQG
ncbi:hypothetical protein HYX11_02755 [Candidatus Woesearchaeota archaeon]|nr:hypothetical protein [Candidatus Woesearchaeota archaeon]